MINRLSRGVYAITPDLDDTDTLLQMTATALSAGLACLQYRNKQADAALALNQARALRDLCAHYNTPLIINDDAELAASIGATGVHLGGDDADVQATRERYGSALLIGASCYNDMQRAERACAAGADYVAFGAMFPSSTKPKAVRASAALLTQARTLQVPVVAIGGITPDNGRAIVQAGADLLAAIDGLFGQGDIAAAVRAYQLCFQ